MARGLLHEVTAKEFRTVIRPALVGRIGVLEPVLAERMADDLQRWTTRVIAETLASTRLHDRERFIYEQLISSVRIYGAYSLNLLRADFFADPWLRIHEYGGTIRPTGGRQFLAIPIHDALRPDGSPKFRNPASWKRWGSFVYKSKNTNKLYLAYKSAGGDLRILYVLVEEVEIPARLGLRQNAEALYPALYEAWAASFLDIAADAGIFNLLDL